MPRIEIVSYKFSWPPEFLSQAARIRDALGARAFAIHHIGSTSVPHLAAKDVIDIQLKVSELNAPIQSELEKIGFSLGPHRQDHCPPGMQLAAEELEKRYYRGARMHLHVRKNGAFNQRYALLFRDFLRANAMAAAAYGEIKLQLARRFPEDVDAYYDVKDPVCDAIMAGALVWAESNAWQPGPPDI
ncbi:MAG: GrpB family protein [Bdellovibrionota bacterium]